MKAFLASIVGIAAISVGAWYGLHALDMSARSTFARPGVSLPAPDPDRPYFN